MGVHVEGAAQICVLGVGCAGSSASTSPLHRYQKQCENYRQDDCTATLRMYCAQNALLLIFGDEPLMDPKTILSGNRLHFNEPYQNLLSRVWQF